MMSKMKGLTLWILSLTSLFWTIGLATTVHAEDVNINWILNEASNSSSSLEVWLSKPSELNQSQVEAQYSILKQFLSPFGWWVAYDTAKSVIFLFNAKQVRSAIGDTTADFFTMLRWGANHMSMYSIAENVWIKPFVILTWLALVFLIMYLLINTKVGEAVWWWNTNTRQTGQGTAWMWMNWMGPGMWGPTNTSADKSGDWIITLWELTSKLNELRKVAQQDPTIAKLAKQSLLFLTALLVFTMIMATMTFDYALTQASNLTPMAYIPLSIILFLAFTYLLVLYVKIAFARLGRFVSNTEEEISPNEIIGDLMMKGFLWMFAIGAIGGLIWIIVKLITSA